MKDEKEEVKPAPLGEGKFAKMFRESSLFKPKTESLGESSEEHKQDGNIGNAATVINFLSEYIHGRSYGRRTDAVELALRNAKDAFKRIESPTSEPPEEQEEYRKGFNEAIDAAKNLMYKNGRQSEGHMISKLKKS